MKLTKAILGKRVEVVWHDPFDWTEEGPDVGDTKGAAEVPTWCHQGVIEDITDGWVRLRQGYCESPRTVPKKEGVMFHEDLLVSVTVLEEDKSATPSDIRG